MVLLASKVNRPLVKVFITLACILTLKEAIAQRKQYIDPLQKKIAGMDTAVRRWKSWNILFKTGTSHASMANAITEVERYIDNYLAGIHPGWHANFDLFYCPCDSTLYNLGATPVDGVGNAVIPPSGGPNPPIPSGDMLALGVNNGIQENYEGKPYKIDTGKLVIPVAANADKILAIIDTGLDSTLLEHHIMTHIWRAPVKQLALYNYITNSRSQFANFFDDQVEKHGSGVLGVAVKAMSPGSLPRLMILKALDGRKKGSTFTVSCAISYAIQNHADAINASLGYYEHNGKVDPILGEYLTRCSKNNIYVFAAAGNLPGTHDPSSLCKHGNMITNQLTPTNLFFPACFSTKIKHVIAVTGLLDLKGSCFYQNFSGTLVTVGVVNDPQCCKFILPFFKFGYEGSSFATPAAVGMTMRKSIDGAIPIDAALNSLIQRANDLRNIVKDGQYLKYTGNPSN
jgi:hypothetical protein